MENKKRNIELCLLVAAMFFSVAFANPSFALDDSSDSSEKRSFLSRSYNSFIDMFGEDEEENKEQEAKQETFYGEPMVEQKMKLPVEKVESVPLEDKSKYHKILPTEILMGGDGRVSSPKVKIEVSTKSQFDELMSNITQTNQEPEPKESVAKKSVEQPKPPEEVQQNKVTDSLVRDIVQQDSFSKEGKVSTVRSSVSSH